MISLRHLLPCRQTAGPAEGLCAEGLVFLKGSPTAVPAPGQVTVIELWAEWCGPCRAVFPHLTKLYKERKDKGLVVVGVCVDDNPNLQAFVDGQGDKMGYLVATDRGHAAGQLMKRAGVSGIPHAFVVDRTGKFVYRCGVRTPLQHSFRTDF
jgi:thiol-disulfide isomerase/thioredoxin